MQKIQRIDFIGNSNNYPLIIVHAMRDIGIDAHMHLIHENPLNAPENRFIRYKTSYPDWIHDWRSPVMLSHAPETVVAIKNAVHGADALVLNNDAVFLGASETRPCFCLLTGSDLLYYADPEKFQEVLDLKISQSSWPSEAAYKCRWLLFILQQRAAIRSANGYSFFPRGTVPRGDELLDSLGSAQRRVSFLVTDTDELQASPPPGNRRLRIVCGSRLTWDRTSPPFHTELDYKGTDVLLNGFARFLRSGRQAELHLFRKGCHVRQTETLVQTLRITDSVQWQPEIAQQDFMRQLEQADIVADSLGSSHIGMTTVDSMAIGRPVIAKTPDEIFWGWEEPIPVCHAVTAENVCEWLIKLHDIPSLREELGTKSRQFALKHFSHRHAAKKVLDALHSPRPEPLEAKVYEKFISHDCFDFIETFLKKNEVVLKELEMTRVVLNSTGLDLAHLHSMLRRSRINRDILHLLLRIEAKAQRIREYFTSRPH